MAYSDFTLKSALDAFGLTLNDGLDLFAQAPSIEPSPIVKMMLPEFLPLALAINTEKARSELLVGPLLATLRAQWQHRFSLFSGIDFTVDPAQGLAGFCDFILARSTEQQFVRSPVAAIVEAKNENLKAGLGPCIAAMVAARIFNEREGSPIVAVHGAVTSGTAWRFLRLTALTVWLDQREYYVDDLPKIIGILSVIALGESAVDASS